MAGHSYTRTQPGGFRAVSPVALAQLAKAAVSIFVDYACYRGPGAVGHQWAATAGGHGVARNDLSIT